MKPGTPNVFSFASPAVPTMASIRFRKITAALGVLVISCLYSTWYLNILTRWWYQDDPHQYHLIKGISNPSAIFLNPEIMRNWGTGNALVPMQLLSYWVDVHLVAPAPFPAYVHNLLGFLAASIMMYIVLVRLTDDWFLAAGTTLVWSILPSTMAVHQFIATRHYMEGLALALMLFYVVSKHLSAEWQKQGRNLSLIGLLGILAVLSKEIYAATVPTLLLMMGIVHGRHGLTALALGVATFYVTYRIVFLGTGISYAMELVDIQEYGNFIAVLPYMFTASSIGYLFYLGTAILAILAFRTDSNRTLKATGVTSVLLGATLLAVYPVTEAVLYTYERAGTWYRVPFLINTLLVLYAASLLSLYHRRFIHITVLLAAALLIAPQSEQTRGQWADAMTRAKTEGMFYLENPDKLLYSEEEAPWFIVGVHELYEVPKNHYINKQFHTDVNALYMVHEYQIIYRYRDGQYVADARLYEQIVKENIERYVGTP